MNDDQVTTIELLSPTMVEVASDISDDALRLWSRLREIQGLSAEHRLIRDLDGILQVLGSEWNRERIISAVKQLQAAGVVKMTTTRSRR